MTKARGSSGKLVIGTAEYVRLPEWRIGAIRAKVDTGARSSALHVENISPVGANHVEFDVVLSKDEAGRRVRVHAPISRRSRVRSSNGRSEVRLFVTTILELGSVSREIEVSLTSRGDMRFRMLLGRSAMAGAFLVDPGRRYVATGNLRSEKRNPNERARS